MEYGQILRRAWQITWKYKFLWVFGIAIALCRGQGGGNGANFNFGNNFPREGNRNGDIPISPEVMRGIQQFVNSPAFWGVIIGFLFLILLLSLLAIAVGAYARGALVRSVNRIENREEMNLSRAWEEGKVSFRPLFWLELILSIPALVIGLAIVALILFVFLNLMRSQALGGGLPPDELMRQIGLAVPLLIGAFCGLVCLGIIIQLFVSIFTVFGSRAIALEGHGVAASFGRAWQVFTQNLAPILLFALILFGINILVGIVIAIPAVLFLGVFAAIAFGAAMSGFWPLFGLLVGGMILVLVAISAFLGGIYRVFVETLWTLVYRQLVGLAPEPRLESSISPNTLDAAS
ncbi:MAG: hypothetical protein Kow0088_18480 [Anaerolineales bacterium]